MNDTTPEPPKLSWWRRLSGGLKRTSSSIGTAITDLVTKRKLDAAMLDELEDVLIRADLGVAVAARIADAVGEGRYDKAISADEVKDVVATEVEKVLAPVAKPLEIDAAQEAVRHPRGRRQRLRQDHDHRQARRKTSRRRPQGDAGGRRHVPRRRDRAAQDLGRAHQAPVIAGAQGADAAGLAFEALTAREGAGHRRAPDRHRRPPAEQGRADGRAGKDRARDAEGRRHAPHAVLLVLDATVGQNALSQVEDFHRTAGVTGLVMTKLDGTARGGILVAIAAKFGLPVHFIGVGEGVDDLAPFTRARFRPRDRRN